MRRGTEALPTGQRILVLVPTSHLAQQVQEHLERLTPPTSTTTDTDPSSRPSLFSRLEQRSETTEAPSQPTSPILLTTPRDLATYETFPAPDLELIFIDELDTMLGPLPARHLSAHSASQHPINRHPPEIISVMNHLLDIVPDAAAVPFKKKKHMKKRESIELNFERRKPIQTVFTSATIQNEVRRFAKLRGWVRAGEEVIYLNFIASATDQQRIIRDLASRLPATVKDEAGYSPEHLTPIIAVEPEHFVLLVDPATGEVSNLDSTMSQSTNHDMPGKTGVVLPVLLEALALLQTTSPPPPGSYDLVLPPEGTSLDLLGDELGDLGITNGLLSPEAVISGSPEDTRLLLARRSTITGLHLPNLHTVYLLSGLDMTGLSPAQKKSGQGRTSRMTFYDIVTGRMGRLGTRAVSMLEKDGGIRQRVVSLVLGGGEEERAMIDMFYSSGDKEGRGGEDRDEGEKVMTVRRLVQWDLEKLRQSLDGELVSDDQPR